jgi:hypothetical protein
MAKGEIMQWEYNAISFAHGRDCAEVCDTINPMGERGWELVCVLDQAADHLKHKADARMLLFKRPLVTYEAPDNRPEPMGPAATGNT